MHLKGISPFNIVNFEGTYSCGTLEAYKQRWIRGYNVRGQDQGLKKNPRLSQKPTFRRETLSRQRTGTVEFFDATCISLSF